MEKKKGYIYLIILFLLSVSLNFTSASAYANNKTSIKSTYLNIPLYFEQNQGQTNKQVKFLSQGQGWTIYFTQNRAVLVLNKNTSQKKNLQADVIGINFLGANKNAEIVGQGGKEGISNYFIGKNPNKWITGILNYKEIRYKQLYPGIGLVFSGNQKNLEFSFVAEQNANPGNIRMQTIGAKKIYIDKKGNLIFSTEQGEIIYKRLIIYQNIAGIKKQVFGRYILNKKDIITFELGSYDKTKPLIIDPTLIYSTYLGGSSYDYGYGIAVDSLGDAYVTGYTDSTDFPTENAIQPTLNGSYNAFVTKINPDGSLIYSTYLGGSNYDYGYGIAVDSLGDAYITGDAESANFPTTENAFQPTLGGEGTAPDNAFVTKLNPAGSILIYSTYLGGSNYDYGYGIAVDSLGDAYVTGYTDSTDFPTENAIQPELGTGSSGNAFVTKLNPTGSSLVYSTYLGGSSYDEGYGIAVDSLGDAYITGDAESANFPTTENAFQPTLGGEGTASDNAFVTKLNPAGSILIYSTYLGGSSYDHGYGIAVDFFGDAYITGNAKSTDFPITQGAFQSELNGSDDAFVTKLNPAGSSLIYSTYLGGSSYDDGYGIAVDFFGDAYVTGYTDSTDFPTENAIQPELGTGSSGNAFVTELNPTGSSLVYSTYLGGSSNNDDEGNGIAVDAFGNAYVTGYTDSTNFPTENAFQPELKGRQNAFVTRISTSIPTSLPLSSGGTGGIPVGPLAIGITSLLIWLKYRKNF